jgi:hypothetical protein
MAKNKQKKKYFYIDQSDLVTLEEQFEKDWTYICNKTRFNVLRNWSKEKYRLWWNDNLKERNEIVKAGLTPVIFRINKQLQYTSENCMWTSLSFIMADNELYKILNKARDLQAFLKKNERFVNKIDMKKGGL